MLDRRTLLTAALALSGAALPRAAMAQTGVSRMTAYGFSFAALDGPDIRLADYANRPILVVNTASQCGYTPQFAGLQALATEFGPRGLAVIGVPSNDFNQEPGSPAEIAQAAHQHGVAFPIAARTVVTGASAHPFYRWAAQARPAEVPRWNFHKYLVGRDGYLAGSFAQSVAPQDTRIKTAIARQLSDA